MPITSQATGEKYVPQSIETHPIVSVHTEISVLINSIFVHSENSIA